MIGTLRYIIQQLSKDDYSFTIDMLIDEIVSLEEKLDSNERSVNELNLENNELKKDILHYQQALGMIKGTYEYGAPDHNGEVEIETEETCDIMYKLAVNATTTTNN